MIAASQGCQRLPGQLLQGDGSAALMRSAPCLPAQVVKLPGDAQAWHALWMQEIAFLHATLYQDMT